MEGGSLTAEKAEAALKGKAGMPEVKAMMSLLEHAIAVARNGSETQHGVQRDEWCGAARELRAVRTQLNTFLSAPVK